MDKSVPFLSFEKQVDSDAGHEHDAPCHQIPVFPTQFGHPFEVHSPDTGQEGQRNEDGRHDGELLHDVVHPLVVVRQIKVDQGRNHIPAAVERLQHELQMVVHISEERAVGLVEQHVVCMKQLVHLFLQREDTFLDEAGISSVGLYVFYFQAAAGFGRKQRFFHVLQFIFHAGDDGHETGHDTVQGHAEQEVRLTVPDFQGIILQGCMDLIEKSLSCSMKVSTKLLPCTMQSCCGTYVFSSCADSCFRMTTL